MSLIHSSEFKSLALYVIEIENGWSDMPAQESMHSVSSLIHLMHVQLLYSITVSTSRVTIPFHLNYNITFSWADEDFDQASAVVKYVPLHNRDCSYHTLFIVGT